MTIRTLPVVATLAFVLLGCTARGPSDAPPTARQQANRITTEELVRGPQTNVYELIQGLRPQWLRGRSAPGLVAGGGGSGSAVVYLDGYRMGGISFLQQLPVPSIGSLEFLEPIEAGARYGMGHENGAILITSRR